MYHRYINHFIENEYEFFGPAFETDDKVSIMYILPNEYCAKLLVIVAEAAYVKGKMDEYSRIG